jgi:hypothetical protein
MNKTEALDMITKLQLAHQAMESACKRLDELKAEKKELKEILILAREALSHTETNIGHPNFEVEEDALLAIDFALEKL